MTRSIGINSLYYILLLSAHIGLVWLLPYFPSQDGPNHINNLLVLHDLINGGNEWGGFFTYQLRAVPNLGFQIISYPMLYVFTPLIVEKIYISIYMLLMGVSVPAFLRTFERPIFPYAYFIFPVIFNFTLLMGFYSYVMAVPLFILAFSLSWKIRNKSISYKFVCLNLAGLIIFYFHLIPFTFFLISLVAITISESTGYKRKIKELVRLLIIILPSILNLFFYLRQGAKTSFPDFSYLFSFLRLIDLIVDLSFFSTVNFLPWQLFPAFLFTLLVVLFSYSSIKYLCQRWLNFGSILASEKSIIYLASAFILIYLFAPFSFGEGNCFNQRFPWVILLIILPLLRIPETMLFRRFDTIVIICIVTLFFAFNASILWRQSTKVEKFLSGLNAGMQKGAFVVTYKPNDTEWSRTDALMHAASYYGIFRGCVDVGNYAVGFRYCPVHFKNIPATPSPDQIAYEPKTIDWRIYPSVQYLLGWEVDNIDKKELGKFFHILWQDGPFTIWQRNVSGL